MCCCRVSGSGVRSSRTRSRSRLRSRRPGAEGSSFSYEAFSEGIKRSVGQGADNLYIYKWRSALKFNSISETGEDWFPRAALSLSSARTPLTPIDHGVGQPRVPPLLQALRRVLGRVLGKGLHSSTCWLNVSTPCEIRWVRSLL